MTETRIWLAQCLCPARHTIIAAAGEADTGRDAVQMIEKPLRKAIVTLLASEALNPWCGLCAATADTWTFETGRMRLSTMAEATVALDELERKQAVTRAAASAYHNDGYPERLCDRCWKTYRGPAVYCSLECALADA